MKPVPDQFFRGVSICRSDAEKVESQGIFLSDLIYLQTITGEQYGAAKKSG